MMLLLLLMASLTSLTSSDDSFNIYNVPLVIDPSPCQDDDRLVIVVHCHPEHFELRYVDGYHYNYMQLHVFITQEHLTNVVGQLDLGSQLQDEADIHCWVSVQAVSG